MTELDAPAYQPGDTLGLWWLVDPTAPRLIGELRQLRGQNGVSLRYGPEWLASGIALSEDLPLTDREYLPSEKETAAGAVDDARPDRWGERVIRVLDKPPRLALLDYLFFAGDERFGALGVSTSLQAYLPRTKGPLPWLNEAEAIARLVQRVLAGEPVPPPQRRLIDPGTTLGGARPKALVTLDGEPWVLKFNEPGEALDMPLVEHATMTLAAQAGIRVAPTRAVPLHQGHAVAVRRFDREAGLRRHALSANVALKAAGEALGYPELAQLLRRRGTVGESGFRAQMHELFRRMVFNILMDNTDDHEKNHALLHEADGTLSLSPAFDVLPSAQSLGWQQMRVGQQGHDATLDNAMSECRQFGLAPDHAREQVRQVVAVVNGWQAHFRQAGVQPRDLEALAAAIDRPALLQQRSAWR